MSIKRYNGSSFTEVESRRRYNGSSWTALTIGKRYDGSSWQDLWSDTSDSSDSDECTGLYYPVDSCNYWGSGNPDSQYPLLLIQGSYASTLATARRAMLLFDCEQIAEDLSGAEVTSVRLRLQRTATTHGIDGDSSVCVKTHNYSAIPDTWDGTDSGSAGGESLTIARGETKWLELDASVGEKLRDGEITGLALDADSDYSMSAYIRLLKSATCLEITYTK